MNFIKFSIDNPVKLTVGVILSLLFGSIAYLATPVQLTPDVTEPELTITTVWPGASAQEIEREIIEKQEEQLKSVEGMDEFKSESSDSAGSITMKFAVGTDLADARARVAEKLNQVPDYPEDAREPGHFHGQRQCERNRMVHSQACPADPRRPAEPDCPESGPERAVRTTDGRHWRNPSADTQPIVRRVSGAEGVHDGVETIPP